MNENKKNEMRIRKMKKNVMKIRKLKIICIIKWQIR